MALSKPEVAALKSILQMESKHARRPGSSTPRCRVAQPSGEWGMPSSTSARGLNSLTISSLRSSGLSTSRPSPARAPGTSSAATSTSRMRANRAGTFQTPQQKKAAAAGLVLWTPDGQPSVCSRQMLLDEGPNKNKEREFIFFWGHKNDPSGKLTNSVFSQWWMEPSTGKRPKTQFTERGNEYVCAEQYMMTGKAAVFSDHDTRRAILQLDSPAKMKNLGRAVKDFDPAVWDAAAFSIVAQASYLKFISNDAMKHYLLGTKAAVLVEASPFDQVWGIGRAVSNKDGKNVDLRDASQWNGANLLGFALVEAREEIHRVHRYEYLLADLDNES